MKNSLLLKALRGEYVERVPVWMMRQAGRYLPEYIKLRKQYSFFERCQTPELACEITLQPVDIIGVDAAIIFSDILVVAQAMGMEVEMIENKGPLLPNPIKNIQDVEKLNTDIEENLSYVFQALSLTKKELYGRVPLIGFAGSPWTLLCYMVQGKGSKTFDEAKGFCFTQPTLAHALLQKITDSTIQYLKLQAKSGADVVQIFDSWGGLLSPQDFEIFSLYYIRQIVSALKDVCPTIVYSKGAWFALEGISKTGAACVGLDWCISANYARSQVGNETTLQGNFDPVRLLSPIPEIRKGVREMINTFGNERYIANLGHGIIPNIPVDHAKAFVEAVKEFSSAKNLNFV